MKRVAGATVSAIAMGAAQSYAGCAWLAGIALVPLFLATDGLGVLSGWALLALFQAIHTALSAYWIRQTGEGFGWFLLAAVAYQAVLTAIPAAAFWIAGRRRAALSPLLFPAIWVLMEMASRRLLFGISWALLGLPLADYSIPSQLASLAGPEALSLVVIAANLALAAAVGKLRRGSFWAPWWKPVLFAAVPALAIVVFGEVRVSDKADAATERIGVVQPMLSQQTRWDRLENRPPLLARLNSLIDHAAATSPALIVLPEAAIPGLARFEPDLAAFATGAVERTRVPLLFGTVDRDQQSNYYNTAILIGTDGNVAEYRKRRLVPFVEHTPWPFSYRPPEGWVQFTPGTEATRVRLNVTTSLSVAMCLEDTYPDMARAYAADGANLLIAMINTENFRDTNQPLAHLRRARLTAIAAGLPIVRVANSGISCSIDAHGRVISTLPPNQEIAGMFSVALATFPTFYGVFGDEGVALLLLAAMAASVFWPARSPARVRVGRRIARPLVR